MKASVNTKGLNDISLRLKDSPEIKKKLVPFFKQASIDLYEHAQREAPTKTGDLSSSITYKFSAGPTVEIGADDSKCKYAKFVYLGTKPHDIFPKEKAPYIKRVTRNGVTFDMKVYHSLAFVPRGYSDSILRRGVRHPGTKPNPFILKSWARHSAEFEKYIKDSMIEILNKDLNL